MLEEGCCVHHAQVNKLFSSNQLDRFKYLSKSDVFQGVECGVCRQCDGLWICLKCLCLLCPRHTLIHYRANSSHLLQVSCQQPLVFWCYQCDSQLCLADSHDQLVSHRGIVGLQNVGNTCYLNAALQALCATPAFVQYFLSRPVPPLHSRLGNNQSGQITTMTCAMHRLLWEMWSSSTGHSIQPTHILYAIRNSHPMFRGFQQHDTQEFLRCLMDQLHEEMKVPSFAPEPVLHLDRVQVGLEGGGSGSEAEEYETCDSGVSERSSLSDETSSSNNRNSRNSSPERVRLKQMIHTTPRQSKKQTIYRSIISDVFDGKLLSSVQCLTCNRISQRVETFQDLSLPIPSRDHVHLLHQGTVNTAKCSLYQADQGWLWWLWDWVCSLFWGPTVSLHDCLAAFFSADELKGDNMYSCEKCNKLRNGVKYSKVVECPEVLCIHLKRIRHELMFSSKISNHVTFPLESLDMAPFIQNNATVLYDLTAVICHYGPAAGGGHYTCFSLNPLDEEWYEYDDHTVRRVSQEVIKSCPAYVLFYRKDNREMEKVRRKCNRFENSSTAPSRYLVSKDWLSRFRTMADPGPVDNRGLICSHGALGLEEFSSLSQSAWEHVISIVGGGPAVRAEDYSFCQQCLQPEPSLLNIQLHEYLRLRGCGEGEYYAVSARWLADWEQYVKGNSHQSPGPINNNNLSSNQNSGGEDYIEMTQGQWEMLVGLYGGGPAVVIRDTSTDEDSRSLDERLSTLSVGDNVDSGCWFAPNYPTQPQSGAESREDETLQHELMEVTSTTPSPSPVPTVQPT